MAKVRVRLVKTIHSNVEYDAVVIGDDGVHIAVHGPWAEAEARDLGLCASNRATCSPTVQRLDEDEFAVSGLAQTDPAAAARAHASLDELEEMAADGFSAIAPGDDEMVADR